MKKIVFFYLFIVFKTCFSQNWQVYSVANSPNPYDSYSHLTIDTNNVKWFVKIQGIGDKTVAYSGVSNWVSYNNVYNSTLFNCRQTNADLRSLLWLISLDNKIYSLKAGVWYKYDPVTTGIANLHGFYDVAIDSKNNKWFCGVNGLAKYNDTLFTLLDTANSNLPFQPIYKVITDINDDILIIGAGGLAKLSNNIWEVHAVPFSVASNIVSDYRMVVDSTNNLWVARGNSGGGLLMFDGVSWTNFIKTNSDIESDSIYGVDVDQQNKIWCSFLGKGIIKFDGTTWTTYDVLDGYPVSTGSIEISVDGFGNKWFITGNGVVEFNENGIVGRDDLFMNENNILIFPNPNNGKFELRSTIKDRLLNLEIYNILGDRISVVNDVSQQVVFDISNCPSGIYIVKVYTHEGVVCKKIIKE
ncbi:MAG: T9SS type A sorting domain-containing protein [Bacteroidia bacterium]|nr:T9SS type A sorting domain-containing protein [Bacteroidia bacterium]